MRTVFYGRVSCSEQNIAHQVTQAEEAGFKIDTTIEDHGVSGISTKLTDRPGGKRLFDILRHGDVLVVRWVDRLGRNYDDVTGSMREFMRMGVIVKTVITQRRHLEQPPRPSHNVAKACPAPRLVDWDLRRLYRLGGVVWGCSRAEHCAVASD